MTNYASWPDSYWPNNIWPAKYWPLRWIVIPSYPNTLSIENFKRDLFRAHATGRKTLAETFYCHFPFELRSIRLHLSAVGGSQDLYVWSISSLGNEYQKVLYKKDMTLVQDLVITFSDDEMMFGRNDRLYFSWGNTSRVTWGLVLYYNIMSGYNDAEHTTSDYNDVAAGRLIYCDDTSIYCDSEDYYCDGSVAQRDIGYTTLTHNEVTYYHDI